MHGWTYSEEEYRAAFPAYLRALHKIAPKASFVWATITPVKVEDKPGPTNARIQERNRIALSFVAHDAIPVNDEYELMTHHADQYEDHVHFNPAGAAIQGQQVAQFIRAALAKR
jgi:lysophospholipase L1-like esterase